MKVELTEKQIKLLIQILSYYQFGAIIDDDFKDDELDNVQNEIDNILKKLFQSK